jgi:hypothetical protein
VMKTGMKSHCQSFSLSFVASLFSGVDDYAHDALDTTGAAKRQWEELYVRLARGDDAHRNPIHFHCLCRHSTHYFHISIFEIYTQ